MESLDRFFEALTEFQRYDLIPLKEDDLQQDLSVDKFKSIQESVKKRREEIRRVNSYKEINNKATEEICFTL